MRKIRVLIVDDAVVVRRIVGDVLAGDPELEVAGAAANGRIALAKIPQVNPDIVTLDAEMPEMDGLETLAAIRKSYPRLPVIMFSTQTERGAAVTLDALALGANDYVTKPANVGSVAVAIQRIREQLIPKLKLLCGRAADAETGLPQAVSTRTRASRPSPAPPRSADRARAEGRKAKARIEIVAVGASTGGPNALAELLPIFPADFPVPIVIVQHMPPVFTRMLAERLTSQCQVPVSEGVCGGRLGPGRVWVAPGDYHMTVARDVLGGRLRLNQEPPENSCRPSVDVLFRSVADSYGPNSLVVVLTGMGQDGLRGCEAVHEVGGQILAQDEASSVVWGMPGFVVRASLADRVLPLDQIGQEIVWRVRRGMFLVAESGSAERRQLWP